MKSAKQRARCNPSDGSCPARTPEQDRVIVLPGVLAIKGPMRQTPSHARFLLAGTLDSHTLVMRFRLDSESCSVGTGKGPMGKHGALRHSMAVTVLSVWAAVGLAWLTLGVSPHAVLAAENAADSSVTDIATEGVASAAPPVKGPGTSYFERFFVDGGPLVWLVLLPLSCATLALIVQYSLTIRRDRLMPTAAMSRIKHLVHAGDLRELTGYLERQDSVLAATLRAGLVQLRAGRAAAEAAMAETLEQRAALLLRRIEWLNIIGNVAPMIGLFGTVWGMVEAFNRIVRAHGQPEADALAGAISIALVTTLWGLFTAIPALAAYGSIRNRIDGLVAEVALAGEDVLSQLAQEQPDRCDVLTGALGAGA